ncbi:MAG: phosphate/phosphite/phosphonate ABC transporter substrate-binding protein [Bifidobacteriaceae bacterium]|jgi:phosphonate transport system substrate-binding protein|nr:phosphate/phosphite/phosphonate ABC transporter substrate-binding protein [Bifidobacteriaceae bacterium]
MRRRSGSVAAVGLAAALALGGCASGQAGNGEPENPERLVFAVVPDSVDTETNYQALADYISHATGLEVDYHESTDYAALIELAIAGKVDVASFSGFSYVTAVNQGAKIDPVSSIVTIKGEEPGYYSQAIVSKSSTVKELADLAGKRICFVDPASTSGYLIPRHTLKNAGVDFDALEPVFAGKHDVSVAKVAAGKECDAGFAEDSEVVKSDEVRVIDSTHVPGSPLVISSALPTEVKDKLRDALSQVTREEIVAAGVEGADSDGFRSVFAATEPVDDAFYDIIRDMCREAEVDHCQS